MTLLFQFMLCFAEKPHWRDVEDESALFSSVKDSEDDSQFEKDAPVTKRKMFKGIKSSPLHSSLSCFYLYSILFIFIFFLFLFSKNIESWDTRKF